MRTLFVTCGATVPFPAMVESIMTLGFLKAMKTRYGFEEIVIQYGLGYDDEFTKILYDRFDSVKGQYLDGDDAADRFGCCDVCQYEIYGDDDGEGKIIVYGLPYSAEIYKIINRSDLVISHAGTGSILDTLRSGESKKSTKKRPLLVVVINDNLMDNHQEEIARRFERNGYLKSSYPDTSSILSSVEQVLDRQFNKEIPSSYNESFANFLCEVSGM